MKDTDFLFLTTMLRARETGMLREDRINRMLDSPGFDEAAKFLIECGYPDMSGMNMTQIENILQERRADIFGELSAYGYALDLLNLFRIKYDYHNVKVLIKSSGDGSDTSYLLSVSGRIHITVLTDAYSTGQRGDLPAHVAEAMASAVGILSRTGNPQLSDIEIDKAYFREITELAKRLNEAFISDYVQFLIDSANLRIVVRATRTGRDSDFVLSALIPGGSHSPEQIAASFDSNALELFTDDAFKLAVRLGIDAMQGSSQTQFELACDNAVLQYVTNTKFISFGPAPIIAFLSKLEWEITVVRMILTGKLTGISPGIIRERLRECNV